MDRAETLVNELKKRQFTITTVESLTAGAISARIADVPGASTVLREAYVTYSNEAKMKLAGVQKSSLNKYTAVSEKVAREMAFGGRVAACADVAISATGIAGPSGGTESTPVGTVYIGCALAGSIAVRRLQLSGTREEIRKASVEEALKLALETLLDI